MTIEKGLEQGYVLITGASSGFGAAIARRFGEAGAKLLLLARREEKLNELRDKLSGESIEVVPLVCDVRDEEKLEALLKPYLPNISVLVNNAGLALGVGSTQNVDMEDWRTMIATNITGVAFVTHLVLPHMVERDRGLIINVGSVAGTYPYPGGNVYGGTKAFVKQFSLNLKAELLGTKVRVSNIEPAASETEFSIVRHKGNESRASEVYDGWEPFTADDIAETVYWIASLPERVNVNSIEIMGTGQSFAGFSIHRKS